MVNNDMISEEGGIVDKSAPQAKTLKDTALNISAMTDEEFSHPEVQSNMARNSRDLVVTLKKQGHAGTSGVVAFAKELAPRKGEDRNKCKKRTADTGRQPPPWPM